MDVRIQRTSLQQIEAEKVLGVYNGNSVAEYDLYEYCADYYNKSYRAIFHASEEVAAEIFQNSFIKLWENITCGKIYVENNVIRGKDNKPLSGSIRTYFMGIARLKYLEWNRENGILIDPEMIQRRQVRDRIFDEKEYMDVMYSDSDNIQLEIIADIISKMPQRCQEILTKFYYEDKDLDRILIEIPSIESKNALKTKKHKCMENLRNVAKETHKRFLQYN